MMLKLLALWLFASVCVCKESPRNSYLWLDYAGLIPPNAVEGGQDAAEEPVYVGQSFVEQIGLIPVGIVPGEEVLAAFYGPKPTTYSRILCGTQHFEWHPSNATDLPTNEYISKYAVTGGYQATSGIVLIGRVVENNGKVVHIGKVNLYDSKWRFDGRLYYVQDGVEKRSDNFEVLVYPEEIFLKP